MKMYQYAAFQMGRTEEAQQANQELAARGNLYGVEVTIPALAKLCVLGNLDPQHSGGQANIPACLAALTCELPPFRATLVTARPDADSVTAMAVLALRAQGWSVQEISCSLLAAIAAGDCAPDGPWIRDYTPPVGFAAANAVAMSFRESLDSRVNTIAAALMGAVQLGTPAPADHSAIKITLTAGGRIAVALADGPAGKGACGAGYREAPVVVALNEAFSLRGETPHRKFTVARWNATHVQMDWDSMLQELQALEPGWGGSSSICGSPQGEGSTLTLEQVLEVVERHLA